MNILMVTNAYAPHTGGIERSVETFSREYRRRGHQVLIITPEYDGSLDLEEGVLRLPAIQNFSGTDFSVSIPIPGYLHEKLDRFRPEIVHSHHPFLLGDTALRIAGRRSLPIVFTHHTMYEDYTHYVPGDSPQMQRFVIRLATGYANLCDRVIAPSASVAQILRKRKVKTPIAVIPTGVRVKDFAAGNARRLRDRFRIPEDAMVLGHVGRLAPEKNLGFLARGVAHVLKDKPPGHFLVVGTGPSVEVIQEEFESAGIPERVHFTGKLEGQDLVDAYHAMDLFIFASLTETQGMVLIEAMAAGVPVVGLEGPGVREVIRDRKNGCLVPHQDETAFAQAIQWFLDCSDEMRMELRTAARNTAEDFSMETTAEKSLELYRLAVLDGPRNAPFEDSHWQKTLQQIRIEWELFKNLTESIVQAVKPDGEQSPDSK